MEPPKHHQGYLDPQQRLKVPLNLNMILIFVKKANMKDWSTSIPPDSGAGRDKSKKNKNLENKKSKIFGDPFQSS